MTTVGLGAFRYRDYRLLWAATMMGSIALWMRILGTAQWLLDETGSAALVGLIGVVQLIVQVPTTLWAGTLADRVDRKRLMTLSYGLTAASLILLGFLNYVGFLSPALVYLGIAVTASTHMLVGPARSALIPVIFPEKDLMLATSTDTASSNIAAIVGPLIFALIATAADLSLVFVAAGAFSFLSMLLPFFIWASGKSENSKDDAPKSQIAQTIDGFRYVANHPILPGLFLLDIGITTASFYREILPVLALGLFAGGASATGMLGAANSVGAIVGSLLALLLVGFRAKGMLVLYASFAYGLILFGFGTVNSLWLGILMIGLLGAADAVTVAVRMTTVMLTTPDNMRGRAFSLMFLAASTANNIGTIWVGFWAASIGADNTMILGGFISITATALIFLLVKPIRAFRSN
ncbi:MAG: MFS transporter [Gammaproteobacteria bacterium]|jgi:sugar phosphate permease|nr:MFS transporter [Gammaproteobacteria bacterium]MBT4494573.1 MFS transporter [Gammaproteobacteria bacterium]